MLALRSLESFARRRDATAASRCELCGAAVGERHAHVVDRQTRALACACAACALLFKDGGAGARRRTVPDRVLVDESFHPSDADWARVQIPVRLAYVIRHDAELCAYFPSPAGPVAAALSPEAASALVATTPLSAVVEPDVEALLVHRPRRGVPRCLVVPVDVCHELSLLVRRSWRGLSGGDEAERAVDGFFARLVARGARRRP